jgi:hypothetical protein
MADIDVTRRGRGEAGERVAGEPFSERTGFRLSWGAIFAGLVVAMVLQLVLALLGVGIGLAWWDQGDPLQTLGIGAGIWAAVSTIIALFAGGATAGRLAGILTPGDGAIHGVLVWGLATITTIFFATSGVSMLVGGTFSAAQSPLAATVFEERQAEIERQAEEAAERLGESLEDVRTQGIPSDTVAQGAWWALLAMALGLGAAVGGATMTARE